MPERPEGCCAQLTPDPLTRLRSAIQESRRLAPRAGITRFASRYSHAAAAPRLRSGCWQPFRGLTPTAKRCHRSAIPIQGYGVRSQLPERPEGCCAQLTPDPLTRLHSAIQESRRLAPRAGISQLATRNSQLAARNSPLAARNSPFHSQPAASALRLRELRLAGRSGERYHFAGRDCR